MKSSYVCTRSSNVGDTDSNNTEMGGVLEREISDSSRHTAFGYPDIWKPVEITSLNAYCK